MSQQQQKRILMIQCTSGMPPRHYEYDPLRRRNNLFNKQTSFLPISIATLAALTPERYEITLWDENLRGHITEETLPDGDYDLVAISVMFTSVRERALGLAQLFRRRGVFVVAGGPGVSTEPEYFRERFDVIFVNEVEKTWPQFLADLEKGEIRQEYRQVERPDLAESPMPRWDLLGKDVREYQYATVQTTRGCPFDCEFCDVIYLFGRQQRHKPIPSVLKEIAAVQKMGAEHVFFTDDEFVGDPRYCKELLRALIPLNNSFPYPLSYSTQETMNLSKDDELLELHADANFHSTLIGIESINPESLKETGKFHNVRVDMLADLQHINSYGIFLLGSFIAGFDHDKVSVFDELYDFILAAGIGRPRVNLATAMPGTRLWSRIKAEDRLIRVIRPRGSKATDAPLSGVARLTNILPKQMSYAELLRGQHELNLKLYEWPMIATRLKAWISQLRRIPHVRQIEMSADDVRTYLSEVPRVFRLVDRPALRACEDVFDSVMRTAPTMAYSVAKMLTLNIQYHLSYSWNRAAAEREIDLAQRGEFELDRRAVALPPQFGPSFHAAFPKVFERLYLNIADKQKVADAAVQVFVDFVVRWGGTFSGQIEPHDLSYLYEICDRVCAQVNGTSPEQFLPRDGGYDDVPLAKARRSRLAEAVLKDVRDELTRISAAAL